MKELVGKLAALDPEAGDALRVVSYFDTLMDGGVGIETLLRGAATLSGVPAGYRRGSRLLRVLADGERGPESDPAGHLTTAAGPDAEVWLERNGPAHANDAMVRERLAVAITQSAVRGADESSGRRAVDLLLTTELPEAERRSAEAHLGLDPTADVRAVALPLGNLAGVSLASATMATPWGIVRGAIARAGENISGPAGVGIAVKVSELPRSWHSAVICLALSSENQPMLRADDLGTLIHLTELINDSSEVPADVASIDLALAHHWTLGALQAVAEAESLRSVAAMARLHHSSVQARLPELARLLGYDPVTPLGRARLYAALLLHRVAHARFDS